MATADMIRDELADAAIMLLAVNGPGAEQVRNAIDLAFPTRSGVSFTVASRARSGTLRPKLLRAEAIAAARAKAEAEVEADWEAAATDSSKPKKGKKPHTFEFRRPAFLR